MATKKKANNPTVDQRLEALAELFEKKNEEYGDTYKLHGQVMDILFPDGIEAAGVNDMNRLGVFNMIVGKVIRYAVNFENGGHADSLDDLAVYAQMLRELEA